jgi:hypothetical protein
MPVVSGAVGRPLPAYAGLAANATAIMTFGRRENMKGTVCLVVVAVVILPGVPFWGARRKDKRNNRVDLSGCSETAGLKWSVEKGFPGPIPGTRCVATAHVRQCVCVFCSIAGRLVRS